MADVGARGKAPIGSKLNSTSLTSPNSFKKRWVRGSWRSLPTSTIPRLSVNGFEGNTRAQMPRFGSEPRSRSFIFSRMRRARTRCGLGSLG